MLLRLEGTNILFNFIDFDIPKLNGDNLPSDLIKEIHELTNGRCFTNRFTITKL